MYFCRLDKKEDDPKRVRIWVSKYTFDKIDKQAKRTGKISGNRIVDNLMDEYVKKENL